MNVPSSETDPAAGPAREAEAAAAGDCPNCGATERGRYCHECGQDNAARRLTIRGTVAALSAEVTDLDSRIWRTVRGLTNRPGHFAREYVEGRRADRAKPFRYALVAFTLTLLLTPAEPPEMAIKSAGVDAEVMAAAWGFVQRWSTAMQFVSIFVAAAAMRLVFFRRPLNYAEHLAATMYMFGHFTALALPFIWIARVRPLAHAAAMMIAQWAYFVWFLKQFHKQRFLPAVGTTALVILIHMIAVLAIGLVVFGVVLGTQSLTFG